MDKVNAELSTAQALMAMPNGTLVQFKLREEYVPKPLPGENVIIADWEDFAWEKRDGDWYSLELEFRRAKAEDDLGFTLDQDYYMGLFQTSPFRASVHHWIDEYEYRLAL